MGAHGAGSFWKTGQIGAWRVASGATAALPTTSSRRLAPGERGELWWPCIVCEIAESDELAFYCPALAWGDARPWGAHHSRVRSVRRELPQWASDSPTTAPSTIAASGTSSAAGYDEMSDSVINDVMSDVGSEVVSEADWGGVWQMPN